MATPTPKKPRFVAGGTVQAGNGIYVRRTADDHLLELCRQGEFAFVLTSRQMGKSSLMVNTMRALKEEDTKSVSVDLTKLGSNLSPEQWYRGFLLIAETQLGLDTDASEWWEEHEQLGFTQRLLLFFQEVILKEVPAPTRIIIFVDEIDSVLSLRDKTTGTSFNVDDFFAAIRALYNERSINPDLERLTFVLIGVATPTDLVQDAGRTPFNIGHRVELDDFTQAQAMPLMGGFESPQVNQDKAAEVLKWVFHWTDGHPFLTQRLCQELASRQIENITKDGVNDIVQEVFLGEKGEQVSNITFVRDMLTRPDRVPDGDLERVLATYHEILAERRPVIDEERSQLKSYLKLSGVVRRENGYLRVRNRIYKRVFNDKWVKEHSPQSYWAEKIKRERVKYLLALATTAAFVLLALFSFSKAKQAEAAATEAKDAKNHALHQQSLAEHATNEAVEYAKRAEQKEEEAKNSANEARKQTQTAKEEKQKAVEATRRAERNLRIAQQREREAYTAAEKADDAQGEAEHNYQLAMQAKVKAEEEEQKANAARELALREQGRAEENQVTASKAAAKSQSQSKASAAMQNLVVNPDGSLTALVAAISDTPQPTDKEAWLAQSNTFRDPDLKSESPPTPAEAQEALRQALLESRRRVIIDAGEAISGIAYGPRSGHGCNEVTGKKAKQCGVYVITASDDNQAKLWYVDADDKQATHHLATLEGHLQQVQWAAFSNELAQSSQRYRIVTASYDNTARVYEFDYGALEKVVAENIRDASQRSPNLHKLREQMDDPAGIIKFVAALEPSGKKSGGERDRLQFAAFAPDNNRVIVASRNGLAYIWERKEGFSKAGQCQLGPADKRAPAVQPCVKYEVVHTLRGHKGVIYSAFYSPQGDRIVTASADNTAIVWDAATGRPLTVLRGHLDWVRQAVFNHDGSEVATAGKDGLAIVWDVKQGSKTYGQRKVPPLSGHTGNIWSIAYNSCALADCGNEERQQLVTAGDDRTARVWNATAGTLIAELRGHTHTIWRAAFSPNGQQVITASEDKTARIWETAKDRRLASFKTVDEPVWLIYGPKHQERPRQHLIATIGDTGYPTLWDADTGEKMRDLKPEKEEQQSGRWHRWFNQMIALFNLKEERVAPTARDTCTQQECARNDLPDKKGVSWRPLLAWNERYFVAVNIEEQDCGPDRWRLSIWDVEGATYKPLKLPTAEYLLAEGAAGRVQRIHLVNRIDRADELVVYYESGHVEFRELCNGGRVTEASELKKLLERDQATIVATNRAGDYLLIKAGDKLRRLNSRSLAYEDEPVSLSDIAATAQFACNNACRKALIVSQPKSQPEASEDAQATLLETDFSSGDKPKVLATNSNEETKVAVRKAAYVTAQGSNEEEEYVLAVIEYWRDSKEGDQEKPERYHAVKVLDAQRKTTSALRGHVTPIMLATPDFTGERVLTVSADGWVRISPNVLFENFNAVLTKAQKARSQKHRVSVSRED